MSHSRVSAPTVARVYAALEHEADMDGLVTVSSIRLGQLAGVDPTTANSAVRQLAESGRVEVKGRATGFGQGARPLLVQMAEAS